MASKPKLKYDSLNAAATAIALTDDMLIKIEGEMAAVDKSIATHREVIDMPCLAPSPLLTQRASLIAQQAIVKAQLMAACDALDWYAANDPFAQPGARR